MKLRKVTVRFPPKLYELLVNEANEDYRSLSKQIVYIVSLHYKRRTNIPPTWSDEKGNWDVTFPAQPDVVPYDVPPDNATDGGPLYTVPTTTA